MVNSTEPELRAASSHRAMRSAAIPSRSSQRLHSAVDPTSCPVSESVGTSEAIRSSGAMQAIAARRSPRSVSPQPTSALETATPGPPTPSASASPRRDVASACSPWAARL